MSKVLRQLPEQSVRSVLKGCRKYERTLVNGQNPRRTGTCEPSSTGSVQLWKRRQY